MSDHVLKPSELKLLLQCDGIKNYKWKGFISGGWFPKLLLENTANNQEVIGKVVSLPSEGELKYWPKLNHQNVNRLLDIVSIDDKVKIFISSVVDKGINDVIHDNNFIQHPLCFYRKISYARDILLGLDYMHQNSMYHLNLTDANVAICPFTDKAVICDFSWTITDEVVKKVLVPTHYSYDPPEIIKAKNYETLDCLPIDMWACGILLLQIFTQHLLPWRGIICDSLECLDIVILRKANIGSSMQMNAVVQLKELLQKMLFEDPKLRFSASRLLKLDFFQNNQYRLDEEARNFWKFYENSQFDNFLDFADESNVFSKDNEIASVKSFQSKLDGTLLNSENQADLSLDQTGTNIPQNIEIGKAYACAIKSEPGSTIYSEDTNQNIYNRLCISVPTLKLRNDLNHSQFFFGENFPVNYSQDLETSKFENEDIRNQHGYEFEQNVDTFSDNKSQEFRSDVLNGWHTGISLSKIDDVFNVQNSNQRDQNSMSIYEQMPIIAAVNSQNDICHHSFPAYHGNVNYICPMACYTSPVSKDYGNISAENHGINEPDVYENGIENDINSCFLELEKQNFLCSSAQDNLNWNSEHMKPFDVNRSIQSEITEYCKMSSISEPKNYVSTSSKKPDDINHTAFPTAKGISTDTTEKERVKSIPSQKEFEGKSDNSILEFMKQERMDSSKDNRRTKPTSWRKDTSVKNSLKIKESDKFEVPVDMLTTCRKPNSTKGNPLPNKENQRKNSRRKWYHKLCLGCKR